MCLTWNVLEHLECTQSVIGGLVAGTFNQSLQCTQDVFVGFQAPSPPVFGTLRARPEHLVGGCGGATEVGGSASVEEGVGGLEGVFEFPLSRALPFSCRVYLLWFETFGGKGSSSPDGGPWQSHLPSGQTVGGGAGDCSLVLGRIFDTGHLGNMDSSKMACAAVKTMLLGAHIKIHPLPPGAVPR